MPHVVLIAIDASPQAEAAFLWYLDHLHQPENQVLILHCVDLSDVSMADHEITSEATFTHMWHNERGKIKALEGEYRCKLEECGLTGKVRSEIGKPGNLIVQVAKEENAGMIVIGSRGLSKLKRTFQSCASDYVMYKASCPVCICRELDTDKDSL